jgi:anti-anti-sigma factor
VTVTDCARYVRVAASGDLDMQTAPELDAALRHAVRNTRAVVLHLSELSFLDSSGINLLLRVTKRSRADGIALSIIPPPPAIARVLELAAVIDYLPLADGTPK